MGGFNLFRGDDCLWIIILIIILCCCCGNDRDDCFCRHDRKICCD